MRPSWPGRWDRRAECGRCQRPSWCPRLLPAARQGLEDAGVAAEEVDQLLTVVEARAAAGQTGAAWQRRALAALEPQHGRERGLTAMLERYLEHQQTDEPVHTWPLPSGR